MASSVNGGRSGAAAFRAAAAVAGAILTAGTSPALAQSAPTPHKFYVRAGAVVEGPVRARFLDRDCASVSPAALYGCGQGPDGAPRSSLGDFGAAAGYELGFGRVAAPGLRLEAVVAHRPRAAFEGRANFLDTGRRQTVAADVSTLSLMLAAYLDLPALGLPRIGPFSPFVGGGAGAAHVAIDETRMDFPRTTTLVPGGARTNFAWMPAAGVAAALGSRVTLEIAWRYTHAGAVDTGLGTGQVVWRDGSRDPLALWLDRTTADLAAHGLAVSMRYAF